jgi:hypothetical protein
MCGVAAGDDDGLDQGLLLSGIVSRVLPPMTVVSREQGAAAPIHPTHNSATRSIGADAPATIVDDDIA